MAYLIYEMQHPDEAMICWLLTDLRHQRRMLAEAERLFRSWRDAELAMERERRGDAP